MQPSESNTKRNIFRASLRREFIESYQHEIRMKYLALEQQERSDQNRNNLKLTVEGIIKNLQEILKLNCQEICTVDNFQYFVSCVEGVFARKGIANSGWDGGWRLQDRERGVGQERYQGGYGRQAQRNWAQNYDRNSFNSDNRGSKITGVWIHKQKMYSLLYRILQKAFSSSTGRLWYTIDRALYLLQFPQLMPLWEKLSGIADEKSKNYCSKQFSNKLLKSSFGSYSDFNIILDPDFVLDILTNFIVQGPCISFNHTLELMPFISYCLNIGKREPDREGLEQESYPKLNKVCIILRSVLKDDSKDRMVKLVDNGFENIFIFLIDETYQLFDARDRTNSYQNGMEEEERSSKSFYRASSMQKNISCGNARYSKKDCRSSFSKKPANLQIITKTNLVKLLNRLFVSNPEIATYLFLKTKNPYFLHSLFSQFLQPFSSCSQSQLSPISPSTQSQNHRQLLKTILVTLHTMLIAGSSIGHSFVMDFLRCQGLGLLENCVELERGGGGEEGGYGREIVSVMAGLDGEAGAFYGRLGEEEFVRFVKAEIELIFVLGARYMENLRELAFHSSTTSINEFLQLRWCLHKQLKLTRNSLLIAYARATEPTIFESSTEFILYSQEHTELLEQLSEVGQTSNAQEQQIKIYSNHILELCGDPKLYMQEHSVGGGRVGL